MPLDYYINSILRYRHQRFPIELGAAEHKSQLICQDVILVPQIQVVTARYRYCARLCQHRLSFVALYREGYQNLELQFGRPFVEQGYKGSQLFHEVLEVRRVLHVACIVDNADDISVLVLTVYEVSQQGADTIAEHVQLDFLRHARVSKMLSDRWVILFDI